MIGKHAPTVHVLRILLLAVGSVITYTEFATSTLASPSAVPGAQMASPLFLPAVSYDSGGSGPASDHGLRCAEDPLASERQDGAGHRVRHDRRLG